MKINGYFVILFFFNLFIFPTNFNWYRPSKKSVKMVKKLVHIGIGLFSGIGASLHVINQLASIFHTRQVIRGFAFFFFFCKPILVFKFDRLCELAQIRVAIVKHFCPKKLKMEEFRHFGGT